MMEGEDSFAAHMLNFAAPDTIIYSNNLFEYLEHEKADFFWIKAKIGRRTIQCNNNHGRTPLAASRVRFQSGPGLLHGPLEFEGTQPRLSDLPGEYP